MTEGQTQPIELWTLPAIVPQVRTMNRRLCLIVNNREFDILRENILLLRMHGRKIRGKEERKEDRKEGR